MQEGVKVDKNLPDRLDNFLKKGSLEKETEILKILETLSEKLTALENKEGNSINREKEEIGKSRLHQKWGKDPFSQEI